MCFIFTFYMSIDTSMVIVIVNVNIKRNLNKGLTTSMLNKSFIYSKIDRGKIDYTHTLYTIIFLGLHSS